MNSTCAYCRKPIEPGQPSKAAIVTNARGFVRVHITCAEARKRARNDSKPSESPLE